MSDGMPRRHRRHVMHGDASHFEGAPAPRLTDRVRALWADRRHRSDGRHRNAPSHGPRSSSPAAAAGAPCRWACSRSSSGATSGPIGSSARRSAPSTARRTPGSRRSRTSSAWPTIWREVKGTDIFPAGTFDGPWAFLQKRPSVHANTGLRAIIESGIDYENLEDATIPIEVVTTSLTDGRERWIGHGPAVEAILASSAIPSIFPPVIIDGDVLVDGGVVNNVPISRAMAARVRPHLRAAVRAAALPPAAAAPPGRGGRSPPSSSPSTPASSASWPSCRRTSRWWSSAAAASPRASTATSRPPRPSSKRGAPRWPTSSIAMRGPPRTWRRPGRPSAESPTRAFPGATVPLIHHQRSWWGRPLPPDRFRRPARSSASLLPGGIGGCPTPRPSRSSIRPSPAGSPGASPTGRPRRRRRPGRTSRQGATSWWPRRPARARPSRGSWSPSMPRIAPPRPERRTGGTPEVLYISPLRALAVDVHENLHVPLSEIREEAARLGLRRSRACGSPSARGTRRRPNGPP